MIITNLLTNMIVLTLQGAVPTNTAAFQDYVFRVIFQRADELASKWHLDRSLITSNKVTHFEATPGPGSYLVGIEFGNRYIFGASDLGFVGFNDESYSERLVFYASHNATNWQKAAEEDLARDRALVEKWRQAANRLTLQKAQQVAESAMRSYGVPMEEMKFKRPREREQLKWTEDWTHSIVTNAEGECVVPRRVEHPASYGLPYYKFT